MSQTGQSGQSTTVAQATASVASAQLDLTNAEVKLAGATLTAPISGTVSTVPFSAGNSATTSESIGIVGGAGVQLSLSIDQSTITSVKVGQAVQVTSAAGTTSHGTVSAIGILPESSDTSSTASYQVTVHVTSPAQGLKPGTTAGAVITVAAARNATLVPISAVTLINNRNGIVNVVGQNHEVTSTPVSLGATGATQVQVTRGVTAGTTLVIADTTSPLPTSDTGSLRRLGGGSMGRGSLGGSGPLRGSRTSGSTRQR